MTIINTQATNIPLVTIPLACTVVLLAMPHVQRLDVSGPFDVFAEANAQAGQAVDRLRVVATAPGPLLVKGTEAARSRHWMIFSIGEADRSSPPALARLAGPIENGLTEAAEFQQVPARLLDPIREERPRALGNEVER
jgi:hypothetical protein